MKLRGFHLEQLVEQQRVFEDALDGFDEDGAEVEDDRRLAHDVEFGREERLDLAVVLVLNQPQVKLALSLAK